jgi:hypothetical protein
MRHAFMQLIAASVLLGSSGATRAQLAPVANLPLTCPSAANVGQPQNNCSALTYQLPTSDQLIVLRSNGTWVQAANLAAAETLTVCALAVQPGTYSSCRDSAGVRRLVQLPKSQVFLPPTPTPTPSGARILDLSRTPVQLTEQGVYVLDRNWWISDLAPPGGAIVITGNGVTLDLRGFELGGESIEVIVSTGSVVTIRNGTVFTEGGTAIRTTGSTRIEHVLASVGSGTAVRLDGLGSAFIESRASAGLSGTGLRAGDGTHVRNSSIYGQGVALNASSLTVVTGNDIGCARADLDFCIELTGSENIFSDNRINLSGYGSSMDGLVVRGDFNHSMDNVFRIGCDTGNRGNRAIVVEGRENTVRSNLVPSCAGAVVWDVGLAFLRDGNLYGDNLIWATVPVNLGATVQTDLGGNVGIAQ